MQILYKKIAVFFTTKSNGNEAVAETKMVVLATAMDVAVPVVGGVGGGGGGGSGGGDGGSVGGGGSKKYNDRGRASCGLWRICFSVNL